MDNQVSRSGTPQFEDVRYADFLLVQTQAWNAGASPEFGARRKVPQLRASIRLRPGLSKIQALPAQAVGEYRLALAEAPTMEPQKPGWGTLRHNEAISPRRRHRHRMLAHRN